MPSESLARVFRAENRRKGETMPDISTLKSKAELEMEISRVLIHFEKEYMGRGPLETRSYLLDDMILVRLKGVLTPSERKLCESQNERSQYLLKQVRNELLSGGRPMLETLIRDIVGVEVRSVHTDISTKTGERIIVFTLEEKPSLISSAESKSRNGHGLDEGAGRTR
jgi:uncharacterized protein YbcI